MEPSLIGISTESQMSPNNSKVGMYALIAVLFLLVGGIVGYIIGSGRGSDEPISVTSPTTTPSESPTNMPSETPTASVTGSPSASLAYNNTQYGFSVTLPSS